jgi:hypothetical protein
LQLGGGLDAELLDEHVPERPVCLQRLPLPARAVEGQHQLAANPLPQRVRRAERRELGNQTIMAAEGEVGVDPPLQRGQVQLLQPSAFGLAQPHGREVGQRRSPPQRQRDAQPRRGGLKCPLAHGVLGFGQQVLEAVQVEFAIADP